MKWKYKKIEPFTRKTKLCFAFTPTKVWSSSKEEWYIIWLWFYEGEYRYEPVMPGMQLVPGPKGWVCINKTIA